MQTNVSYNSRAHISECKMCFNVEFSTYHFDMKMKILADFQICISVPLKMMTVDKVTSNIIFQLWKKKDRNVIIDRSNLFDQPIKKDFKNMITL